MDHIRNFCIIAHIDHGKSTLADRLIQRTLGVADRDFHNQLLDNMELEQERGITIKSQAVALPYKGPKGSSMVFNLIDTPGHVDFSYEVSRALSSCEGALLLVDASQGVEAQTLANLYMAMQHDLEIIPVINKIDLPAADIPACRAQIDHDLGLDGEEALLCSAKTGDGVDDIMAALAARIPPPKGNPDAPLQARIFDAVYDSYRGVIIYMRVVNGRIRAGERIRLWAMGTVHRVEEVGVMQLKLVPRGELSAGEVGYVIAGIKTVEDARTGDTITIDTNPCAAPLPGFSEVKPVVFSSIYPISTDDYEELAEAMARLKLNDASLTFQKDSSAILGQGFRCGFLGLLHLEIVQQRLEREHDQAILLTAPSVQYEVDLKTGETITIDNPVHYPDVSTIAAVREPFIRAAFILPAEFIGPVISLCISRRGIQKEMNYLDPRRVELFFELPLADVLFDFYDKLKTVSKGYASFDYDFIDLRETKLVKLDILVNHEIVDALSVLVHEGYAQERARQICKQLVETIPRHQFKVPIQGAIGGKIIARETINPVRKDVTAKCYGGDISRKRKLLEKQKKGKKRMMEVGQVTIPQEAFLAVLKTGEE
ncbi:MAG: translation elongation factor 4 [Myxococcota bacterium]|jgi:GTP-binding protein LepA|nr:translation elongation factor 4 [Myxococcota bacterium]